MNDMSDDERLLRELSEAVRAAQDVPASVLAAGHAAFAWRNVDAELATLTQDSAVAPAGTRAEPWALRSLSFVAGDLSIEVELTADALQGQIVPPQTGVLEVRSWDGSGSTVPVDEVGWFGVRPVPQTMFRLHLRTASGAMLVTEWITV